MIQVLNFRIGRSSKQIHCFTLLVLLSYLLTFSTTAFARDISFSWNISDDDPSVDGYRLYYKIGNPSNTLNDYDGTDASGNNSSPVEVLGKSTNSLTLVNLIDTEKYSFVLTSFRGSEESLPTNSLTIDASASNTPPNADNSSLVTNEDIQYSGALSASDQDNDPLTFSIVSNGSKGTVVIDDVNSGTYTYTPNANESGSDSFKFRVSDGTVSSSNATVNVTISAVNDQPLASASTIATSINTTYSGQLIASDIDSNNLSYSIVTNGSKGTADIADIATGDFTYTPDQGATGSDSFSFKVNDGDLDSLVANVVVNIVDDSIIEEQFGEVTGADYPGTLTDTYINLNTTNYEGNDSLITYSWSPSSTHKIANTIILKADLSSIPNYATISEAKLQLYQTNASGSSEYSNTVHKIIGKNPVISEVNGYDATGSIAWNAVPSGTTYDNIPLGLANIDTAEDTVALDYQNGYRTWMITNMVQAWVSDPSGNYGLLIKGVESAMEGGRIFASSENQNLNIRPKLIVRYSLRPLAPQLLLIEEIK